MVFVVNLVFLCGRETESVFLVCFCFFGGAFSPNIVHVVHLDGKISPLGGAKCLTFAEVGQRYMTKSDVTQVSIKARRKKEKEESLSINKSSH